MSFQQFISCDWGTSNFRLRLVGVEGLTVTAEYSSPKGIAMMNNEWLQSKSPETERESFYLQFIANCLEQWSAYDSDPSIPVVISGMASSNIGIRPLEYATLPFPANGANAIATWIPARDILKHPLLLVSGLRNDDDVMRGEETQLSGLAQLIGLSKNEKHLFILPGTHSKHISVHEGQITDFRTYMTGEFFSMISNHSIIKNSIAKHADSNLNSTDAFLQGVRASVDHHILHSVFTVRTNQLFKKMSVEENYEYLSGLLIGAELNAADLTSRKLVLAGETSLLQLYKEAINELWFTEQLAVIPTEKLTTALVAGQYEVLKTHPFQNELHRSTP